MARIEIAIALMLSLGQSAVAQTAATQTPDKPQAAQKDDLTELDVTDLAKMTVTSASKKAESAFGVASAIYVITAEDIKRSGAPNIPEALRMVPGIQVAQISASQYAVSARGFNSQFAAKLLVLIDGRSIYNNLYGGVYWEDQGIPMDEIERIEVIRGPGGTLWGANAVNGVINIITKLAKDSKGLTVTTGAATAGSNMLSEAIEYGGSTKHGDFRISALALRDQQSMLANGQGAGDEMGGGRANFRYDGGSDATAKILLEGDIYKFNTPSSVTVPTNTFPYSTKYPNTDPSLGGSALFKIDKSAKDGSSNSFQATYDSVHRGTVSFIDRDSSIDLQLQHAFKQYGANSLMAGLEYRLVADDYASSAPTLTPVAAKRTVYSGFIQDQVDLNKKTKFTIGTKIEHNDFTNWEIQPSARISIQPDDKQAVWFAVSRAVSTSNRADSDISIPVQYTPFPVGGGNYAPGQVVLMGNPNLSSVDLFSLEAGYRKELSEKASLDLSAFQNSYTNLNSTVMGAPIVSGIPIIVPINIANTGSAVTRGLELSTKIQATDKLRIDLGYAYEMMMSDTSLNEFGTPTHEIKEMATYTLNKQLSFDQAIYFAGANTDGNPAYTKFDFQVRYQANKNLEASLGARNLFQGNYSEIGGNALAGANLVQPAIYGSVTLKF